MFAWRVLNESHDHKDIDEPAQLQPTTSEFVAKYRRKHNLTDPEQYHQEQEKKKNIYQFNFEEFHKSNKRFQTEKKETEEVQPLSLPKMEPVEDPQDDSYRFSLQKVLDEYSATTIQRHINPLLVCIIRHK